LLLVLLFAAAAGMSPADVARVRDLSYRQQYDSALAITSAAITADRSDPAGLYWQAAVLQLLINDSGQGGLADSFHTLSDRAIAVCRQWLEQDPGDSQAHFYYGMTQLNRASFLGWQQRKLPAFRAMLDVAPHLNAALARDPSLDDARFGLGMTEYFRAVSDRYTFGLPLLGSRKKAYAAVRPAADGDGPLKTAAQVMMAYMLKEDGKYDSSMSYCRQLLAAYPGNRSVMRMMRDGLLEGRRFAAAVEVSAELDSLLPRAFPDNKYGIAENWIVWSKALAELGRGDEARVYLNRVVAWEGHQDHVPWLRHYVREAKQWLKRLDR
jgi:tetratricopeptide (TPR) repeat protein